MRVLIVILILSLPACGWVEEYKTPTEYPGTSDDSKVTFFKWTPKYFQVTLISRHDGTKDHVEYEWNNGEPYGHYKLPTGNYKIRYRGIPWHSLELFNDELSVHFIQGHTYRMRSSVERPWVSNKPYKVSIRIEDVTQGVKVTDIVTHCYLSTASGKMPVVCPGVYGVDHR